MVLNMSVKNNVNVSVSICVREVTTLIRYNRDTHTLVDDNGTLIKNNTISDAMKRRDNNFSIQRKRIKKKRMKYKHKFDVFVQKMNTYMGV